MKNAPSLDVAGLPFVAAGILGWVIHLLLTPLLPTPAGFAAVAASNAFLWRGVLASLVALSIMFGAAGLLYRPEGEAPRWGGIAAALAMAGAAILLAQEWGQLFIVRTLAIEQPGPLLQMDRATGTSMYDLGAMLALAAFALGCIALTVASLLTRGAHKIGPALVIAGLLSTPLLAGVIRGGAGAMLGNAVMDLGWVLWGISRLRSPRVTAAEGLARAG